MTHVQPQHVDSIPLRALNSPRLTGMPGSESHHPSRKPRSQVMDNSRWATIQRIWKRSYASDYLGFAILLVLYVLLQVFQEPFHRLFYLNDHRLQYPHAEVERVPVAWLFLYGGGIPLAIIIVWLLVTRSPLQKAHVTVLSFLIALILTSFLTDIVKNSVGRPRPDLIARCKPKAGTPPDKLVGVEVCTETKPHLLQDGWRSFPSGHSSFAFSGLGYLGFFFASQVNALRPNVDLARMILVLAPFVCAALIAISRLEDYRHDVFDVTAGSTLGATIAYLTWRRHYPKLTSPHCATPYSLLAVEKCGFRRLRDEEEGPAGSARNGNRQGDYEVGSDSD
ncbi:phosphatidic acid phosphatase type 2/haloperoxidase [Elsinoe ampelina]|uniref:Phosphatidic acid phosphatase type 2/haloperoxidase n=1 Tax=Elsinoe ampelina TaxID=302913 RepID=A0A6A6GNM3_9PEZI|nr:phosphatidic acid phosphatase type 2/haloperoxidase [Elsinoe ampelina]